MRHYSLYVMLVCVAALFGQLPAVAGYAESMPPVAASPPQMRSENSLFTFLFMARQQASVKMFDDTRRSFRERTNTTPGQIGFVTGSQSQTTGGSTEKTADQVTYTLLSSQDIDSAMGEVLTVAGIEYAAYDDVMVAGNGPDPVVIKAEFVHKDDMSAIMRAKVIAAARDAEVKYFATGTIDVNMSDVHPITGSKRVYVSVRANLWDIEPLIPRKVGAVGPVQFSGLGPDQSVASRNALIVAAKETAAILVEQLNAKRVR